MLDTKTSCMQPSARDRATELDCMDRLELGLFTCMSVSAMVCNSEQQCAVVSQWCAVVISSDGVH